MKKLCVLLGLAGVMAAPNLFAALDGTLTLGYGSFNGNSGGEFSATSVSGSLGAGNFLTFCIEDNEFFSPPGTYSYIINSGAVAGGVSGQDATDTHAVYYGTSTYLPMDKISVGTAWLYSQFRANPSSITTDSQAEALQLAIWFLEGEKFQSDLTADAKAYLTAAEAGTGKIDYTGLEQDATYGEYGVVALNLYSTSPVVSGAAKVTINGQNFYVAQDQLGIIPVPEPATVLAGALLLLPFGASAMRILRRNRIA